MPEMLACPDETSLRNLARGEIPAADAPSIFAHLANCPHCWKRLESLPAIDDSLIQALSAGQMRSRPEEQDAIRRLLDRVSGLVSKTAAQNGDRTGELPPSAEAVDSNFSWVDTPEQPPTEDDDGLAPPKTPSELGRLGPYRVLKVLGEGGMGKVFLAEDPALKRQIALKVMKKSVAANPNAKRRFLQEAQTAAQTEHDNIVHIYQVGEDRGVPFLAMPLLKGMSLEDLLRRSSPLTLKQTIGIGIQIASGLAAAHANNLIHRDIKPGNVWIETSGSGRVKILDFGLARSTEGEVGLTQSGAILGTPLYMAPEQARGEKVGPRADLYSLGCVLYRMATGELPIKGRDAMAILTALALDEPVAPCLIRPEIPVALSDFILKLLAKDPNKRVGSATEVVQTLRAIACGDAASPKPDVSGFLSDSMAQATPVVPPPSAVPLSESTNPFAHLDSVSEPDPARPVGGPRKAPPPGGKRRTMTILAGALLLLGGGLIYQFGFQTADGTLLVEVDKEADVRIKEAKLEIREPKSGNLLYTLKPSEKNKKLPPGDYSIDVVGSDGLTVNTKEFKLAKNGEASVRVVIAPMASVGRPAPLPAKSATPPPPAEAGGIRFEPFGGINDPLPFNPRQPHTLEFDVTFAADTLRLQYLFTVNGCIDLSFQNSGVVGLTVGPWPEHRGQVNARLPRSKQRVFVAATFDDDTGRILFDGKEVGRVQLKGEALADRPLVCFFGMRGPTPQEDRTAFMGVIHRVRISRGVRPDAELTPAGEWKSDDRTLLLYDFRQNPGETARDLSGNDRHGKIHDAKWVKPSGAGPDDPYRRLAEWVCGPRDGEWGIGLDDGSWHGPGQADRLPNRPFKIRHVEGVSIGANLTEKWLEMLGSLPEPSIIVLKLNFQYRKVPDEVFEKLCKLPALRKLQAFSPFYAFLSERGIMHLKNLPELRAVYLDNAEVTADALKVLAANCVFDDFLNIRDPQKGFSEESLKHLPPNLQSFELVNGGLSDAGMAHLGNFKQLSSVHLINGTVTDEGLKQLLGMTELKEVVMKGMPKVTARGIGLIQKEFPNCKIEWDGQDQKVPDNPAAVARWMLENKKVGWIDVERNGQQERVIASDIPAEPFKVVKIDFDPAKTGGKLAEGDFARLAVLTDVEELNFAGQPLTDADLEKLVPLKSLRRLGLRDTKVTPVAALMLRRFPNLQHLDGTGDETWLKNLAGTKGLRSLRVSGSSLSAEALSVFKDFPKLRELELDGVQIQDDDLKKLAEAKGLWVLKLNGTSVTVDRAKELAKAMPDSEIRHRSKDGKATTLNEGQADPQRKVAQFVLGHSEPGRLHFHKRANPEKEWWIGSEEKDRLPEEPFFISYLETKTAFNPSLLIDVLEGITEPTIRILNIDCIRQGMTVGEFERFCNLPALGNLREFQLTQFANPTLEHLQHLKKWPKLDTFTPAATPVPKGFLKFASENLHLAALRLYIRQPDVTEEELRFVPPNLQAFTLENSPALTDAGMAYLGKSKIQVELVLSDGQVTDDGLKSLHGLNGLKVLAIRKMPKVTAKGIDALKKALPNCKVEWDGK